MLKVTGFYVNKRMDNMFKVASKLGLKALVVTVACIASASLDVEASKGIITLDAGHGHNTPGKRAADGSFREWDINDKVADYVELKLEEQGYEVIRLDDTTGQTDVSLNTRLARAKEESSNLHISIHQNALDDIMWSNATGTETYYSNNGSWSVKQLAQDVAQRMANYIGTSNRGAKGTTNELFITREFTRSGIDAILVEGLFMDNEQDVQTMQTDEYVVEYGQAIVDGIMSTYGAVQVSTAAQQGEFIVRVRKDINETLNVRKDPTFTSEVVTEVNPGDVFTITEVRNGMGRLRSGAGWISLSEKYTERLASLN